MGLLVTPLLTEIDNCDNDATWDNGADQSDVFVEGTGAMSLKVSNALGTVCKHDQGGVNGVDMSSEHFYVWILCTGKLDLKVNGGMRIYAEDKNGAWREWWVAGVDTYPGGWKRFAVDPNKAGDDSGGGVYDPTVHRYIGVRFKTVVKWTGATPNCFWDWIAYGSGLKMTSGVADQVTLEQIYQDDKTNAYGIISKIGGIYFALGELQFGDVAAGNIDFKDKNQIVVFEDNDYIASDLYKITVVGNGAGTTNFQLGTKSGNSGIEGCIIKSGGSVKFTFTAIDVDIDVLKLYGCTFLDAGIIKLPSNAAGREALNSNFNACAQVEPDTFLLQYCNFISSDGRAVLMNTTSHNIKDCNFIGCVDAVHIPTADTYTFDNLQFSGCTYDVENSSAGLVTVLNTNGSSASKPHNTGGGTIEFETTVYLIVQRVKTGDEPAEYVRCYVEAAAGGPESEGTELMNKDATESMGGGWYKTTQTYNYQDDQPVIIRAREKGWLPFEALGTITSAGLTVTAVWLEDPNYIP